jgi:RNA polymerase sigma-70 factor (ECF subfamily)
MLLQERQPISDAELVNLVRAGKTAVYEVLMRRYNQRLYRVIRSVIVDDVEAEDVLQEAWVRAYQYLNQFEGRASFSTWVTRIALHEALARIRKARRWTPIEDPQGAIMPEAKPQMRTSESPETLAMRSQVGQILQAAMDALPEVYRSVFVFREVEQFNTIETAECLGLSEEAVKTRLHRARALLRHELQSRVGSAVVHAYSFMGARCDRTVARVLERISSSGSPPEDRSRSLNPPKTSCNCSTESPDPEQAA